MTPTTGTGSDDDLLADKSDGQDVATPEGGRPDDGGATEDGATEDGATEDGATEDGATEDGISDAETVEDESPLAGAAGQTHDAGPDEHDGADAHDHGTSLSAMALRTLILVLIVFGLSLWLVPMAAPFLPVSIARHIMPGQQQLDDRLAELDAALSARAGAAVADVAAMRNEIAALTERLTAAEAAAARARDDAAAARAEAEASAKAASAATVAESVVSQAETAARQAAEAAETATTAATEAGKVAAAATRDTASLARQMTSFEARLASLTDQIGAFGESLAATPTEGAGPSPELVAAFTALKSRIDGLGAELAATKKFLTREEADRFATQDDLRSARTALGADIKDGFERLPAPGEIATATDIAALRKALDGRIGALAGRVESAEKTAASAVATAETASTASAEAVGKVRSAIRDASMRSAIAALTSRLENGAPFESALDEIERLTGSAPPEALANAGTTGVATTEALLRRFGRSAQAAISADIRSGSEDDGIFGQASARLRSVVAGRPKSEQPGDDTGAIISRVEARLRDGALAEALAEAGALSEPARTALGEWLDRLKARVAADAAAATYIAVLGSDDG